MLRVLKLKEKSSNIKELMHYAILGYNSSIHSVTKHKPFDIIHCRVRNLDPFSITDKIILNQYIVDRRERLKTLYDQIHEVSLNPKEKYI